MGALEKIICLSIPPTPQKKNPENWIIETQRAENSIILINIFYRFFWNGFYRCLVKLSRDVYNEVKLAYIFHSWAFLCGLFRSLFNTTYVALLAVPNTYADTRLLAVLRYIVNLLTSLVWSL